MSLLDGKVWSSLHTENHVWNRRKDTGINWVTSFLWEFFEFGRGAEWWGWNFRKRDVLGDVQKW
jgi:hypothetical protein